MAIDFFKNGVGVEVQIGHKDAVWRDLLKFQVAGSGGAQNIDVGFMVVLRSLTRTSKSLPSHYAELEYSCDFIDRLDSVTMPVPVQFAGL